MKPVLFSSVRPVPRLRGMGVALALAASAFTLHASAVQAQSAEQSKSKDYVLMHKSSYTPSASPRNPFWPIGWVPTAAVVTETVVVATVKPEDFVVSSISMDYPPLAVINKRTYSVGDRIPVPVSGAAGTGSTPSSTEFVTLRQITDGVVVLDHRGKQMRITTAAPVMAPVPKK